MGLENSLTFAFIIGLVLGAGIIIVLNFEPLNQQEAPNFRATYCDVNSGDCVSFDLDKRVLDHEARLNRIEEYLINQIIVAQQAQQVQAQGGGAE